MQDKSDYNSKPDLLDSLTFRFCSFYPCFCGLWEGNKNRSIAKRWFGVVVILASIANIGGYYRLRHSRNNGAPVDKDFIRKLETAKHFKSEFPAQMQTIDLAKTASSRSAALNAIGMEPRDVGMMATGSPEAVFAMLSHLEAWGDPLGRSMEQFPRQAAGGQPFVRISH